jgi:hypothetical protein
LAPARENIEPRFAAGQTQISIIRAVNSDDASPHISQHHAGKGGGADAGKLNNRETFQRA